MKQKPIPTSKPLRAWLMSEPGRMARVAAALSVSDKAVMKWRDKGVPSARVLDVCALSGLSPYKVRPDLYPDPAWRPRDVAHEQPQRSAA